MSGYGDKYLGGGTSKGVRVWGMHGMMIMIYIRGRLRGWKRSNKKH